MVGTKDDAPCFGCDFTVTTAATTGVQNFEAFQFSQFHSGFRGECGPVFIRVRDFVFIPLQAEAGKVFLLDKAGNSLEYRIGLAGLGIDQLLL